ncbi:TPA: DUF1642 domain-containing protein [Streptococcus suis]
MNKQEAIEKIYNASWDSPDYEGLVVKVETVNEIIYQIHEPQKVMVPKFVAEWIEYCKSNELTLLGAFDPVSEHGIGLANTFTGEVWKGVDWAKRNQETFARAWLDGFEIEQEKLYEVTVPGTSNYKNQRQHLVKQGKHWFFCGNDVNRFKYRFTKGQLEAAGFGWVFDCDGVKVVEVEL